MSDTGARMRITIYYAIWATICAALAGLAVTLIHTWFFSFNPGRSAVLKTLFEGSMTALAIAAAQGATVVVAGGVLAQLRRELRSTVLLGLAIGLFDFAMYMLQMAVPKTELGWVPDLVILVSVAALITVGGSRASAA
jgi:hypothetical protein